MTSPINDMLPAEAARIYVAHGLPLIPVRPDSKAPVAADWQTRPAVTTEAEAGIAFIDPASNIGLRPGSDFAVIDIDTKNGGKGRESLAELVKRYGELTPTWETRSPSGNDAGARIYRLPPDHDLTFQRRMLGLPDLEFRTGPVNHILPPSRVVYPDGTVGQARWVPGRAPGEIEVATLPAEVIEALRAHVAGEPDVPAPRDRGGAAAYIADQMRKAASASADDRLPEFAPIREGCDFIRHADENAATLTEPEWYASTSITARCRDGEEITHRLSAPHPGYSRAETDAKMRQAVAASGPRTCENIADKLDFEGCRRCPFRGRFKSPIELGRLPPKPRDPRTKEVTGYDLLKRVRIQKRVIIDGQTGRVLDPATGEVESDRSFAANHRDKIGRNVIDTLLSWTTTPRAKRFDYLPGDDRLMVDGVANTWRPGGPEPIDDPKAAAPILDHFTALIPDEASRNHLLDYIAHLLQHPGIKIAHTVCLTGPEGTGKTTIAAIPIAMLGRANAKEVGGKQLSSRFKDGLVNKQVVIVEEANHGERFEVTEDLKHWFTAHETFPVEGKGVPFYDARPPRGIIILSNHDAPLVIGRGSRRFMIIATTQTRPAAEHFKRVHAAIADPVAIGAFKCFLLARDLTGFNAHVEPPRTQARELAEEASRTPWAERLADAIRQGRHPFHRDIVHIGEVIAALTLPSLATIAGGQRTEIITAKRAADALKSLGASRWQGGRQLILTRGQPTERLWVFRDHTRWQGADDAAVRAEATRLPAQATNVTPMPTRQAEVAGPRHSAEVEAEA